MVLLFEIAPSCTTRCLRVFNAFLHLLPQRVSYLFHFIPDRLGAFAFDSGCKENLSELHDELVLKTVGSRRWQVEKVYGGTVTNAFILKTHQTENEKISVCLKCF